MKRRMKLTPYEKKIEAALSNGEYQSVSKEEFDKIAKALAARKKDSVLNLRINGGDLNSLKNKAAERGVKYQTFIAEILHRAAMS